MRCHSMIVNVVYKFTQAVDTCFIFRCVGGRIFWRRSIELVFMNLQFGIFITTNKGFSKVLERFRNK